MSSESNSFLRHQGVASATTGMTTPVASMPSTATTTAASASAHHHYITTTTTTTTSTTTAMTADPEFSKRLLKTMEEEKTHARETAHQHRKLLKAKLQSLRGLLDEIHADSWMYNNETKK